MKILFSHRGAENSRILFLAMSTPQRRLAAAAAAAAHRPLTDLLARVISRCDPADIARVAAVSLLFHASLALEGIRLRAQERGFELPAQPEGESCAVRWLCCSALLRESNPPVRAAAGSSDSVFIDGEGWLSSCGSAPSYAPELLGHGDAVTQLNTPTRLSSPLGGERAVSVSAGAYHSLALTSSGVWSWGWGGHGRLGHGDDQAQWQPKKIEALADQRVVAVSAGGLHSLTLTADGAVWSWGHGGYGQLGHGDWQNQLQPKKVEAFGGQRVVAVSAGLAHTLAITTDGAVWSWGDGGAGRLGHGDGQDRLLPKAVEAFAGQRVVAVSAGAQHSLALTANGAVWSWGSEIFGKLGHGDTQQHWQQKKIKALAGQRVVAVSAGFFHSIALAADGGLWSWGDGRFGKLGHSDEQSQSLPKKIEAFAGQRVVAVSAGENHTLALTADSAIFTWGKGEHGCLGHGEDDVSNQLLPKKVEAWEPAAQ